MRINSSYKLHEVAGEKMLVIKSAAGADLTRVVMLNSTAEMLWNTFQEKEFEQSNLVELLIQKYGIEASQAATDAEKWVSSMLKAGLIAL